MVVPADPEGMVWVARNSPEALGSAVGYTLPGGTRGSTASPELVDYLELITFPITSNSFSVYHDEEVLETRVLARDLGNDTIVCHTIDRYLQLRTEALPVTYGYPHLMVDLDLDGFEELVVQRGDGFNGFLDIHSAPSWDLRARFVLPGMNMIFHPNAVDVDDDPHLEVHLTPATGPFPDFGRVMVVDYDTGSGQFFVAADVASAPGSLGYSAAADFDDDGNVEFITGNGMAYHVYEYVDGRIVHRGALPGVYGGKCARAVRPTPDGAMRALLSHQGPEQGWLHQLARATGDNTFELEWSAAQVVSTVGTAWSFCADSDNDGLDEMVVRIPPYWRLYEYLEEEGALVETYSWYAYGSESLEFFGSSDFDQDGVFEWCAARGSLPDWFVAFEDQSVPPPPLFADGFDSGDTAAWTWVVW